MPQLNRDHNVIIRGTIGGDRGRIRTPYSIEEVIENNKTSMFPMQPPKVHYEVRIDNPQVYPTGPNGTFTPEEQFIHDKISQTNKKGEPFSNGPQLWLQNKLPDAVLNVAVLVPQPDGSQAAERLELEDELGAGVPVMVIASAFNTPKGDGKSFHTVIVQSREDVRYRGAQVNNALATLGIAVKGDLSQRPVAPAAPQAPAAPEAPVQQQAMTPPPAPQPTDFMSQQPAPARQEPAHLMSQLAQPPAPVQQQQAQPQMPAQPTLNTPAHQQASPFAASPVTEQQQTSPFAQQQPAQQQAPAEQTEQPSGITYDPSASTSAFPEGWN